MSRLRFFLTVLVVSLSLNSFEAQAGKGGEFAKKYGGTVGKKVYSGVKRVARAALGSAKVVVGTGVAFVGAKVAVFTGHTGILEVGAVTAASGGKNLGQALVPKTVRPEILSTEKPKGGY